MHNNNPAQSKMPLRQKVALLLFGLFLTLVVLEIGLRLGGFIILSLQEHKNRLSFQKKGAYRILCLGESTTAGQYPPFLEEILNQRNMGIKFSVIDKGIMGSNTRFILSQLEDNLNNYQPDLVVTMMGINDSGVIMPYEAVSTSRIKLFLKSFRIYKLTRLLWLHLITKAKTIGFYNPQSNSNVIQRLEHNPGEIGLKKAYTQQHNPTQQEETFKKAIEFNPKNDSAYIELGWFYRDQGKFIEAAQAFKKAIEFNPKNDSAYRELGWLYKDQGKFIEAEQAFKKAIEINPKDDSAYMELGWLYKDQGKLIEAEQTFNKYIENNPRDDGAYIELGWLYTDQKKLTQAEQVLKKAIEINPKNDLAYERLATVYDEIGNHKLLKEYRGKADSIRRKYYNPLTINNYLRLKQILDRRKIRLACAQYPMRSIELLRKIFKEEGIIFIDNERVFKEALSKGKYREYFKDLFAGDFGHCTDKGNRLLAENIANVILGKVFGR